MDIYSAEAGEGALTQRQYALLQALDGAPDGLTQTELVHATGIDRSTHFEVWVSSQRAYLYLNGNPYGCVDLPSGAPGAGSGSTWR